LKRVAARGGGFQLQEEMKHLFRKEEYLQAEGGDSPP